MLLTDLLVAGIDYNAVERDKISNSSFLKPNLIEEVVGYEENDSFLDIDNTYLFDFNSISNIYETFTLKLKEEFEKNNISSNVYITSYDLISLLPESILFKLEVDNLYPTNYGTIVLDWEDDKSNDEFSLEIGNSCFGYFSEFDGEDRVIIEEVSFSPQEVSKLYKKIEEFYQR